MVINLKKYIFLEDYTADIAFVAFGKTLEETFINAAEALMDIQTDIRQISPKECFDVEIEGYDLEQLLKRWLEELIYFLDAKQMLLCKFDISIKTKETEEGVTYVLRGRVCGEIFDPIKHVSKVEVKAVSYHDMEIGKKDNMYYAKVLVDI